MTYEKFIKGLFTYLVENHGWQQLTKKEISEKNNSNIKKIVSYIYEDKKWELVYTLWGHGRDNYHTLTEYLLLFENGYFSSSNKLNFKLDKIHYLNNKNITWHVDRTVQQPLNKILQQEMFINGCIADDEPLADVYEKLAYFYQEFMAFNGDVFRYYIKKQTERNIKDSKGKDKIQCLIRQKDIPCTPEEISRQGILNYLLEIAKVPKENILVEELLTEWQSSSKGRIDILITKFDEDNIHNPLAIIEVKKGYGFPIDTDEISDQISHYSNELNNPPYLFTTNGEDIYDVKNSKFITKFPSYSMMIK